MQPLHIVPPFGRFVTSSWKVLSAHGSSCRACWLASVTKKPLHVEDTHHSSQVGVNCDEVWIFLRRAKRALVFIFPSSVAMSWFLVVHQRWWCLPDCQHLAAPWPLPNIAQGTWGLCLWVCRLNVPSPAAVPVMEVIHNLVTHSRMVRYQGVLLQGLLLPLFCLGKYPVLTFAEVVSVNRNSRNFWSEMLRGRGRTLWSRTFGGNTVLLVARSSLLKQYWSNASNLY